MGNVAQKVILIAAAFLIVLGGVGAAIYTTYQEKEQVLAECQLLKDEIAGYDKRIALREGRRKQKENIEDNFAALVEILPQASPQQQDKILGILTQIAAATKVKPRGLVQETRVAGGTAAAPAAPQPPGRPQSQYGDAFQQTTVRVQFEGTFANFMRFLNQVENYPNFLRIDEIDLRPARTETEHLVLDIKLALSTFSYVVR